MKKHILKLCTLALIAFTVSANACEVCTYQTSLNQHLKDADLIVLATFKGQTPIKQTANFKYEGGISQLAIKDTLKGELSEKAIEVQRFVGKCDYGLPPLANNQDVSYLIMLDTKQIEDKTTYQLKKCSPVFSVFNNKIEYNSRYLSLEEIKNLASKGQPQRKNA